MGTAGREGGAEKEASERLERNWWAKNSREISGLHSKSRSYRRRRAEVTVERMGEKKAAGGKERLGTCCGAWEERLGIVTPEDLDTTGVAEVVAACLRLRENKRGRFGGQHYVNGSVGYPIKKTVKTGNDDRRAE